LKLLIAVKSEIIADSLATALSMYDIHICATGPDALAMLETLQPDTLILDLSLPVIDGLTLLRKSHYKPKHILALTSFVNSAVLQAAADAGVQSLVLIPCTIRYIVQQLDTITENAPSAGS